MADVTIGDLDDAPRPLPRDALLELELPGSDPASGKTSLSDLAVDLAAQVGTVSGTSRSIIAADAGAYLRFTNAAVKTVTVQDEADEALPDNFEVHVRNVGAGALTIVEDTAVTINAPFGGTLVIPQGGTATLKRVSSDEFDLFGVTVPA